MHQTYTLHESSPILLSKMGRSLRNVTATPTLDGPLLRGATPYDSMGVQVYSVLHDAGTFRMWYFAWPEDANGKEDRILIGYAESDDGFNWRRPSLGQVELNGSTANNIVDLPLLSPAVFIDSTAPAAQRYRLVGYGSPRFGISHQPSRVSAIGYYTGFSSDGFVWHLDDTSPRWLGRDVITAGWDPYRQRAYISLKTLRRFGGLNRRVFSDALFEQGLYSHARLSLVPDEYDDLRAHQHGGVAGDYYGMGWVPAPDMTFGLLWNFHVEAPYTLTTPPHYDPIGLYGYVEPSIVWRDGPLDQWNHLRGRQPFIAAGDPSTWYGGGIYTASQSLRVGDEEWMYVTGCRLWHGDYLDHHWKPDDARVALARRLGFAETGLLRWKAGRLLGLAAPLYDECQLDLPAASSGHELFLNARTWHDGAIRVELVARADKSVLPGYSRDECIPINGDQLRAPVRWQDHNLLPGSEEKPYFIKLCLDCAAIHTIEIAPPGHATSR